MALSAYDEFLLQYVLDDNKVTNKDINTFLDDGGTEKQAQDFLSKIETQSTKDGSKFGDFNAKIGDQAYTAAGTTAPQEFLAGAVEELNEPGGLDDYAGYAEIDYGYFTDNREDVQAFTSGQADLNRLNSIALTNIQTASNEAVAGIYAGADIFDSQVTLSGYNLEDSRIRDLTEYTTTVEDDRLRDFKDKDIAYGLNLQTIINSGLADVATIQGTYSVSGIGLRGQFDKDIAEIRTAGDQDIARTNMMGSMMAGFWNSIG